MPLDSDLTLAATVATELGVLASDPKLPRYISAASDAIRRYLSRAQLHYSAAYVDKVASFGRPRLVLELTPVVAVASVVLADGTTVAATDYVVEDAENGFLYRDGGWPYTGNLRPGLLYSDRDAGSEKRSVTVTYSGGWVTPQQNVVTPALTRTLPFDLEDAAIQTCVALYREAGLDGRIQAESLGDYSVTYGAVSKGGIIPDKALGVLDRFARLV